MRDSLAAPLITLVLGGARSGKSVLAEKLVLETGLEPVYVATAEVLDEEMTARVAAHRGRRGAAWRLVEEPVALAEAIGRESATTRAVLVDCLTLWLSTLLLRKADPLAEAVRLVEALGSARGPVILVSNEVGQGIVPANALARRFIDEAGRLHQRIAAKADQVVLVVAGLPLWVKGGPRPTGEQPCIS
jgi:adenosylcobinamide kinase/adenosylcobinamide-phosphate guanylyltransferase